MKISCEIIKDMLPLYLDGVCSKETKEMVEEHIVYCDECKTELQSMKQVLPINTQEQNLTEAEAIKKLSKKWRKGMLKSVLKGVLFGILAIAIVLLILYIFMGIDIVPSMN